MPDQLHGRRPNLSKHIIAVDQTLIKRRHSRHQQKPLKRNHLTKAMLHRIQYDFSFLTNNAYDYQQ